MTEPASEAIEQVTEVPEAETPAKPKPTRAELVYRWRCEGLTFREIGESIGTGPQRARQIFLQQEGRVKMATG